MNEPTDVKAETTSNQGESAADYASWIEHWGRVVEDWKSSGLSQAEFCRQRNLITTTFNGWKRKLLGQGAGPQRVRAPRASVADAGSSGHSSGRSTTKAVASTFVPVRVAAGSASASWSVEVVCANGCQWTGTLTGLVDGNLYGFWGEEESWGTSFRLRT